MRSKIGPIILLVIGVWFAGFAGTAKGEGKSLPNILVILVDDLGWGDLSCFGAPDLQTPHVDRLAQEGMRMVNFYANCPVCSPTRASLLTGCYPDKVGVPGVIRTHSWNSWGYLNPQIELLPGCLAKAGYQTALVGKWHLGLDRPNIPTARGFGYFHGFLGDMMDDFWNHRRHGINYMRENEQEIDPPGHATDLFTEWACNYIRTHRAKSPDVPFFLYLAYNAPHVPIQPPEDWLNRYRERHPGATEKRAKLAAFIEHMDDGVGRVLKTLDDTGVAANTIVIFTSDNGKAPYRGAKE
ncbi:MAG TPA: sulfatase-like hydrolase/transferase, partial [Sedimentisphaerales bacterium]|nr:sulfatase-like hydrolase/transferase [Sedimentisphaerales bacterium]